LADWYVKLRGRELIYDVTLLSYRNLKKLVREFTVHDYTVDIIKNPTHYAADDLVRDGHWLTRVSGGLLRRVLPLIPIHVWLIEKPEEGRELCWHDVWTERDY